MIAQVPMLDDRKTGYQFLSKVNASTYHPGEDLNAGETGYADLGLNVHAMADGEVVYSRNAGSGWGNLVVIWHEELGVWSRYAHFQSVSVVAGQRVSKGKVIGRCGKSGTGSPHCHWEVLKKKLDRWTRYPNGWSKEKVLEYWVSPYEFVREANSKASVVPEYAVEAVKKAQEKLISIKTDDINSIVGNATAEQIFINLGVLHQKEGDLSKARLLVALERLGLLG